jgi:hypothetical protein
MFFLQTFGRMERVIGRSPAMAWRWLTECNCAAKVNPEKREAVGRAGKRFAPRDREPVLESDRDILTVVIARLSRPKDGVASARL